MKYTFVPSPLILGTFGQDEPWDVFNPNTFKHPMVPYDVLVDPQSMPNHPIFDQKSTSSMSEYICDESLDDGQASGEADMLDEGSGSSHGDEIEEKEEVEEREDDKKVKLVIRHILWRHLLRDWFNQRYKVKFGATYWHTMFKISAFDATPVKT